MSQFWKGFVKEAEHAQVATVAVTDGECILMGRRRDNEKWTTPGGHMEPGEKPVEGAKRELFEEAGINADPKDLVHKGTKTITKPDGKKITVHAFLYHTDRQKTSMKKDPDEEVYSWGWKKLPLSKDIAENLHVQKGNVLFDAIGIEYPQAQEKAASVYNAVIKHMEQGSTNQPAPAKSEKQEETRNVDNKDEAGDADHQPEEKEDPNTTPNEKTAIAHRLMKMKIKRIPVTKEEAFNLSNQVAQVYSQNEQD